METFLRRIVILCLTLFILTQTSADIVFNVSPRSKAVLIGHDVTLDCVAKETSGQPLEYSWQFNGLPSSLPLLPNNSLYIAQISSTQLGSYACLVTSINSQASIRSDPATIVKAYLEEFYIHPTSVSVVQGNETMFECVTGRSAPPPVVYWQKDGSRFTKGQVDSGRFGEEGDGGAVQISSRLVISTAIDSIGVYRCVAGNKLTKDVQFSDGANLTVKIIPESPTIISSPSASLIRAATVSLTMDCGVKGHPYPDITWYHDGSYIVDSPRIQTMENGTLHFEELRQEDHGIYFCVAQNVIGRDRSHDVNLTVAVLDIPFVLNPTDVNILAGRELTLQCLPPRSIPDVTTIWYKDTLPFTERDGEFEARLLGNGTLYFRNVQIADEGRYFCVAVNDYAVPRTRTSETAMVTVEASPLIREPPVPNRFVVGQLLALKCRVQGRPRPEIKWYKDNEQLEEGGRFNIRDSGMELLVYNVIKDDEGSYACAASNKHGQVMSAPALAFIIVPPEITNPPEDVTVREGTDVIIPCRVYGDPRPTVTWYKDGTELVPRSDVTVNDKGVTLTSVRRKDEGTYSCKASNEGGTKQAEGILRIEVVPLLTTHPESKSIVEGQPLVLYCDGDAFPTPNFYWKFNGSRSLPQEIRIDDGGRSLEVEYARSNLTGSYMCIAENDAGLDTYTVDILVQVPPSIQFISGDVVLEQGHDLFLTCKAEGVPRPSVRWSFGGKTIIPTVDARVSFPEFDSLLIKFVRSENSGGYKCTAENEAGIVEKTVHIFVRETPFPPKILSVRAVSMTSVNVTWETVMQDPNNAVDAWVLQYKQTQMAVYVVYKNDIPASLTSYEVAGLSPYTEYVFRVAAKNIVGIGHYSESYGTRTLKTAPSAPRNLHMLSHNASSISLRWELPAQTNGEIRAYQVHFRAMHRDREFSVEMVSPPSKTLQHYTLADLEPFTTYAVKVRGATIEGSMYLWGEFSRELNITTSSIAPSKAPHDVKVRVRSSRSISVSWEPLPLAFHHGPLHGYVIQYRRNDFTDRRYQNMTTSPTVHSLTLTSLLPWREYDIRVRGYNMKGYGTASDDITVRTMPEVPTGSPTDVQVVALSSTSIAVLWEPVPVEKRNSALSGYIVEYRFVGDVESDTLSLDVGDPGVTHLNITGLLPYSEYLVQVHAFTTQVVNGFGPRSPAVKVRTDESIPGPVTNVTINVTYALAYITWDPPAQPNGVIENYHVVYTLLTSSPESSRKRRAVGQLISNNTWEIVTNETEVTVIGLVPDNRYAFHVVAETGAGQGEVPEIPMATVDVPRAPTTTTSQQTSAALLMTTIVTIAAESEIIPTSDHPGEEGRDYLPIIIGSSVGGALIIVVLVALIVLCCYRRSTKKGSYSIAPQPGLTDRMTGNSNMQQSILAPNATSNGTQSTKSNDSMVPSVNGQPSASPTIRTTITTVPSSISLREAVPGYSASSHASRPRSDLATSSSQLFARGIPLDPLHDLSYSSMDELRPSTLPHVHHPGAHYMPPYTGLENPAYVGDGSHEFSSVFSPNTDLTFLRNSAIYRSQQDLYAQMSLNKRRKNRMKSQTAAAIAVQKNLTSSMFLDTDTLINNDAVVVYDERTAL